MRKLFIGLTVLVLFLVADVLIIWIVTPNAKTPVEAVRKTGPTVLAYILAKSLKARMTLPQKVDETTDLENISAAQNRVIYRMVIKLDNTQFQATYAGIKDNLVKTACAREDYRKFFQYGLAIVFSLHSMGGMEGEPIVLAPQSCEYQ